jgi:hypothetical protein
MSRIRSTNGYEQRRQAALAEVSSTKLKAAAQSLPKVMRRFIFHKVKAYVRGERELR